MKEKDELGYRLMSYLYNRTSDKNQECREWRNVTLKFFYSLYELMDKNPALDVYAWEVDGLRISTFASNGSLFTLRKTILSLMSAMLCLLRRMKAPGL